MKNTLYYKVIVSLTLSILVTGCSSAPMDDYERLLTRPNNITYDSPIDAVHKVHTTMLPVGEFQSVEIRITDPIMKLDNVLSNFQVFETKKLDIGSYALEVGTGCYECLGFRKKTLLPYVQLYNSNFKQVASIDQPSKVPFGYSIKKLFDVLTEDKIFILIAADNRSLGKSSLETSNAYLNSGTIPVTMPVQISPEGNAAVRLSKIE